MTTMDEQCRGPKSNVGTVNLWKLPESDAEGVKSGELLVDVKYPSYIMVAQKSY